MSKITHDEILNVVCKENSIQSQTLIINYVKQQEKQGKLLGLYQSLCKDYPQKIWHKEYEQIKEIEKEKVKMKLPKFKLNETVITEKGRGSVVDIFMDLKEGKVRYYLVEIYENGFLYFESELEKVLEQPKNKDKLLELYQKLNHEIDIDYLNNDERYTLAQIEEIEKEIKKEKK